MDEFDTVLCLCPSSRLSLASLVLSTWTGVRRYVLTEDATRVTDLHGISAVLVMDRFVTRELVEPLAQKLPVVVLAWNGMFEIDSYRKTLVGLDVIYMGTDERIEADVRYLPLIKGQCGYARWRDLYRHRRQFGVLGGTGYRVRWLRTRAMPYRPLSVLLSAAGALRRGPQLRKTLASALVTDKLVWAGNCYLDFAAIGLPPEQEAAVAQRIEAVRARPSPEAQLAAALELISDWQTTAASLPNDRAHQAFYVTNTLLRWAVLACLQATAREATWFFGRDNLGLGLAMELYVHNLVPTERVAFLEFGGKTSESGLYPRSLHLLARELYVIPIPPPSERDAILATVEQLRRGVDEDRHRFFADLEQRRRAVYGSVPAEATLADVQQRVWRDFAAR
jgi:hypothetical protein